MYFLLLHNIEITIIFGKNFNTIPKANILFIFILITDFRINLHSCN